MTQVTINRDRFHIANDIIEWCKQNFGPGKWGYMAVDDTRRWSVDSAFGNHHFYFREEADANWFKLKWLN